MFASSCLKTARAAVWKLHAGNNQMMALARGIVNICCYICPQVRWLPWREEIERPPRERQRGKAQTQWRALWNTDPWCDALAGPPGTEGLTSWGAHNDARPVVWADTATVRCGIKLKYLKWKDTHAPFQNGGAHRVPLSQTDLLPGAGHQPPQGLPAQSLSGQMAAQGFKQGWTHCLLVSWSAAPPSKSFLLPTCDLRSVSLSCAIWQI